MWDQTPKGVWLKTVVGLCECSGCPCGIIYRSRKWVTLFIDVSLQGLCHTELHSALHTIAASQQALGEKFTTFYLPNCDKRGFYKAKQVSLNAKTHMYSLELLRPPPMVCFHVVAWSSRYMFCICICTLRSENQALNHVPLSLYVRPVSITVRDVPRGPARALLVRVRLERKENRRIRRRPRRRPLPPGDHSLNRAAFLTHTYTQSCVSFKKHFS